jgi:hypothetical protein
MMRAFTQVDVNGADSAYPSIYADRSELIDAPTPWQKRGLQETASGYGARLTSGYKIRFCGRDYRIYVTCYGNSGSLWFTVKGQRIYVS